MMNCEMLKVKSLCRHLMVDLKDNKRRFLPKSRTKRTNWNKEKY